MHWGRRAKRCSQSVLAPLSHVASGAYRSKSETLSLSLRQPKASCAKQKKRCQRQTRSNASHSWCSVLSAASSSISMLPLIFQRQTMAASRTLTAEPDLPSIELQASAVRCPSIVDLKCSDLFEAVGPEPHLHFSRLRADTTSVRLLA